MKRAKTYCHQCNFETPGFPLYVRIKRKMIKCGVMCSLCGRVHTTHFPKLFLLREDAIQLGKKWYNMQLLQPGVTHD